ncbi:MAG: pentapeptide repeat-containing protein [Chitinispirillaceae bacterium]|nr:pentapeptide repeat-containing protein [Chitinispirillaceae bacterium]
MDQQYTTDTTFDGATFKTLTFAQGVFETCRFSGCDFTGYDFSGCTFIDGEFADCNLSLVPLNATVFRDVIFSNGKMLGLHFENCDRFGLSASFDHCLLDHSSFYRAVLKKTVFRATRLLEVDFSGSDLVGAVFDDCDLSGAVFNRTNLEKADLRTSFGYTIDPEINNLKKTKFSLDGVPGLLHKYGIEIEI